MNDLSELRLHAEALAAAVAENKKFFASINHYVRRLRQLLAETPQNLTLRELEVVADQIEEFFSRWRPSPNPTPGDFYIEPRETADLQATVEEVNRLVAQLATLPEADFRQLAAASSGSSQGEDRPHAPASTSCVFIGHGRSRLWARVKIFLEDELGLATVTYESESRTGESIVPLLENMLGQCNFAVIVLTAEDETAEGARRARQNVVHEAGLFQGRLGFRKAVLLVQEGLEGFSNVDGLQHIPFNGDNVEHAFYELQRVLKREKLL